MTKPPSRFWRNKNVLVTGANGFLGSWLCQSLASSGAHVVGLIRDFMPESYLSLTGTDRAISSVFGSLEDFLLIERVLNEFDIDTCFHLGAQAIVTTANRCPLSTYESNIRGTWNLLEAVRRAKNVERVIVASSDKAYGSQKQMPYTEEAPLTGSNPYDFSKTCTDLMAQMYAKSYGLPVAIARCGNFFGPGDFRFSRIVPGTIRSLVAGERPIIRSNGRYIRDYFYIEDAVSAYLALGERLEAFRGQAFNFGAEEPTSVLELVHAITRVSGKNNLRPKILGVADGEIPVQYLSCRKARRILRWTPRHSLQSALKTTYAWYEDFLTRRR